MLQLKNTRVNPVGAVQVSQDWAPDAAWVFDNLADTVSGKPSSSASGTTRVITRHGPGISVGKSSNAHVLRCNPDVDNIGDGDFTVAVSFILNALGGYVVIGRYRDNSSAAVQDWFLGGDAVGTNVLFTVCCGSSWFEVKVASPMATGALNTLVGRRKGTTIDVMRYTGGALVASASLTNAGLTTVNYTPARQLKLGELDLGPVFNADVTALSGALFKRALTDQQCLSLAQNPWQIFR